MSTTGRQGHLHRAAWPGVRVLSRRENHPILLLDAPHEKAYSGSAGIESGARFSNMFLHANRFSAISDLGGARVAPQRLSIRYADNIGSGEYMA